MIAARELQRFAREGAALLAREADVVQFELYCASTEQLVTRLNFTSEIPSRGVEECKSIGADGFAVRIVSRRNPREIGAAHCAGDLSLDSLRETLGRARRARVDDPHFPGLPDAPRRLKTANSGRDGLIKSSGGVLAAAAWKIIGGAIAELAKGERAASDPPGLVLGGDVTLVRDRFALASSGFTDLRTDETAYFSASVTALVEALDAKGTAIAAGGSLAELYRQVPRLGREALGRALTLQNGVRPPEGKYRVLLGPQPMAEILCYMVMPSVTTGSFYAASSAYHGRFGAQVMDRRLSLVDEPRKRGRVLIRRVTCEGLPTRRSELVREGRLIGLLSNFYDAHRLSRDEHRADKLGRAAPADPVFAAASGYRLGEGGGRRFDAPASASGTNVVLRARRGAGERELIRAVGDGIYIGRVWYTYPINGQRAGDFTCTVSGDSWVIRNGRPVAPLAPNSLRINANLEEIFTRPIAVGSRVAPALVWGSPEVYYAPALVAAGIRLAPIGSDRSAP